MTKCPNCGEGYNRCPHCEETYCPVCLRTEKDLQEDEIWRKCDECSKPMEEGFVIHEGQYYFCDEECLLKNMTWEEYLELHEDGDGDSYWTIWEGE
jgi:hypothetical protein